MQNPDESAGLMAGALNPQYGGQTTPPATTDDSDLPTYPSWRFIFGELAWLFVPLLLDRLCAGLIVDFIIAKDFDEIGPHVYSASGPFLALRRTIEIPLMGVLLAVPSLIGLEQGKIKRHAQGGAGAAEKIKQAESSINTVFNCAMFYCATAGILFGGGLHRKAGDFLSSFQYETIACSISQEYFTTWG